MKKVLLTAILVSTIILSACAAPLSNQEETPTDNKNSKTTTEQTEKASTETTKTTSDTEKNTPETEESSAESAVKEFTMIAKQWDFEPSTITVNKGDKVKLIINSIDVKHGFAISEFNVKEDLNPNEETVVEFVADKKGEFSFFCSIFCGSGHGEMTGTLIVN